ncbi:MAG: xanthine dehydrogenase family protein molybdopterin-binding subunit [Halobacteriaceae archaeon]
MTDDDGLVGEGITRREDRALLTGQAEFTDDVDAPPETVHLAFVRSQYGHADVRDIETREAAATDGVIATYTWADLAASEAPCIIAARTEHLDAEVPGHPVLARDRVRYQGQPVAAVVATDRYTARSAARSVDVDYDRREAVTDPDAATAEDAPVLFDAAPDNVAVVGEVGDETSARDAIAEADHELTLPLRNNRLIPNAIEPRAALAEWEPADERLTVTMTSQNPHGHRSDLASTLGLPEQRVRVISPDVGGGFGHKGHHHPGESMAAWAAMQLERPVRWTATRSENYAAGAHGRDHRTEATLGVDEDGTFQGLVVETTANAGGYALGSGPLLAAWYGRLLANQYTFDAIHCRTTAVFTNTAPVHSYRGAGRPEAIYVTERLVNVAARTLEQDPVEIRRANQIPPDAFPHETPTGATYDSGAYAPALETAVEGLDPEPRARAAGSQPDEAGRYVGLGLGAYVESTGGGFESAIVRVTPGGGVSVYAGTHSHGQGHETTYAQIVADELGVDYDDIDVSEGDTDSVPEGTGTFGSRSAIVGGNAVAESARKIAERARQLAAHNLECDPDDVEIANGEAHVRGAPDRSIPFAEVAATAYSRDRPEGVDRGLEATTFHEVEATAYTFGTHAAIVAVDPETGAVDVLDYVAVDDCGPRLNPRIVEGQIHGGVAQGVGQALSESARYDDAGTLVSGSLQDYAVPRAPDLPEVRTEATVTPSPTNELGVKGIGEAGTIAAPPAIVNAVVDALAPLDVDPADVQMPLTEERVWSAIHEAAADRRETE